MTAGEAIRYIQAHRMIHHLHEPRAINISTALDMACEALEKVEEYKELEEQGLLLRLPCVDYS